MKRTLGNVLTSLFATSYISRYVQVYYQVTNRSGGLKSSVCHAKSKITIVSCDAGSRVGRLLQTVSVLLKKARVMIIEMSTFHSDYKPQLGFLKHFEASPQAANSAVRDPSTLAHEIHILDRKQGCWESVYTEIGQLEADIDARVIVLNYLDAQVIHELRERFKFPDEVFAAHLEKCEQHHSGTWKPSDFTAEPLLPSTAHVKHFVSLDYRRPYRIDQARSFEDFEYNRLRRCSLLRSFHWAHRSKALYHHERVAMAWVRTEKNTGKHYQLCSIQKVTNA